MHRYDVSRNRNKRKSYQTDQIYQTARIQILSVKSNISGRKNIWDVENTSYRENESALAENESILMRTNSILSLLIITLSFDDVSNFYNTFCLMKIEGTRWTTHRREPRIFRL